MGTCTTDPIELKKNVDEQEPAVKKMKAEKKGGGKKRVGRVNETNKKCTHLQA